MKTRSKRVSPRVRLEQEIRWLDLLIIAIGGVDWKSVFEVRQTIDTIIPPHAIYRKAPQYKRWTPTVLSHKLTILGSTIRYAVRNGIAERSIPISHKPGRIVGNYYLRLTTQGRARLGRIKRYLCTECLNTGITRPIVLENAYCGHCGSRHLRFY